MRVRKLLGREGFDPALRGAHWVAQFSSLGSIGRDWLAERQASFCAGKCAGSQPGTPNGARPHAHAQAALAGACMPHAWYGS